MSRLNSLLSSALGALGPDHGHFVAALHDSGAPAPDGTVWGGEILAGADAGAGQGLQRRGLLFPVRMPGGETIGSERWRMSCAWLLAAGDEQLTPPIPARLRGSVDAERWEAAAEMARTGVSSPLTTSSGRLLDAVDAIAGLPLGGGTAAGGRDAGEATAYPLPLIEEGEAPLILDARETFRAAVAELADGAAPAAVRVRVVLAIADATARALIQVASATGAGTAVLVGDAFADETLAAASAERLRDGGLRVLIARRS